MDICRTCNEPYNGYGDGWDGECPTCADKTWQQEEAAKEKDSDE